MFQDRKRAASKENFGSVKKPGRSARKSRRRGLTGLSVNTPLASKGGAKGSGRRRPPSSRRAARALGDLTNKKDRRGGLRKRGGMGAGAAAPPRARMDLGAAIKAAVGDLNLDDLLGDVEDVEIVHGSSKPVPLDLGIDVGKVNQARMQLKKAAAEEGEREKLSFDDPDLDALFADSEVVEQKGAKKSLDDIDLSEFALF